MTKFQYHAGFQFIVSTPTQTKDKQVRRAIRSHATKAGKARRQTVPLRSWISPNHELGSLNQAVFDGATTPESSPSISRVGSAFSGLQLPPGIEPCMIQNLVKLINLDKHGIYPYEICLDVNIVERGWFPYMVNDICCLHSMMFSVHAFTEGASPGQLSRAACLHYAKTLQLLQARLNAPDQTSAISDSTIMVVFVLASAAELMEDFKAVENHVKGLEKIVGLRGGVGSLNTHNNMHVKVCRADLSHSLLTGHPPVLFNTDTIDYTPFIATNPSLAPCTHGPLTTAIHTYLLTALPSSLYTTFHDLHSFSCISNLAFQTTRKLSPVIYNEIMISVLYRLTLLSFAADDDKDKEDHKVVVLLHEAVRLGLLVCCTMLYMQRLYMECPYNQLVDLYRASLARLHATTTTTTTTSESSAAPAPTPIPAPIIFWLVMIAHVVSHDNHNNNKKEEQQLSSSSSPSSAEDGDDHVWWMSSWLDKTIQHVPGLDTWSQAREMLRELVWVDFVHEKRGKKVFEEAMLRIGRRGKARAGAGAGAFSA